MPGIAVEAFLIDDDNTEKFWEHGLYREEVMDKREIEELQDPKTWDDETTEVLPPATAAKVVVPVAFTPAEFARVARYAREHGVTTSECIHDAVLDRVAGTEPAQLPRSRA